MSVYRLINAPPSPYGRKVAIALLEKGIAFETTFDLPWAEAVETRRHSPLEQLPILLVDGEDPVHDSSFILQWLELKHPYPSLLPAAVEEKIAALRLQMLGERLMEIAQALIFEQYRDPKSEQAIERAERKIEGGLREVERLLAREESMSSDTRIHLGDIALGTTLLVWEFVVAQQMSPPLDALVWRGRYSAITTHVETLEKRRSFQLTKPQAMSVDIAGEVA